MHCNFFILSVIAHVQMLINLLIQELVTPNTDSFL